MADEDRPLTADEWARGLKALSGYALVIAANVLFWGQMAHNAALLPNFLEFQCFDDEHKNETFYLTVALFIVGMGLIPRRRRDTTQNP